MAQFPIVRGSVPSGRRQSAGDARNRMQFNDLEVVARDGIESSTHGFSRQRRAEFGASKTKTGKGFLLVRPNRPV